MKRKVIDISKHQQSFNAATAKAAGVEGIMIRHAYASGMDSKALGWAPNIHAQGLPLGGYGFATWHYKSRNGGSEDTARALMHQQVNAWISAAKQSGCGYWFAVDQELESGAQMGLGAAANTRLLNEACDLLAKAGLHPCVYCSVAWEMNYIKSADLRYLYWLARYWDGKADFGGRGADIQRLPDGQYTRRMIALKDAGRLIGWQFASTGLGHKYGAGSENLDRNVFYMDPEGDKPNMGDVQPVEDAQYIAVGPLSSGGLAAVKAKLDELKIPNYTEEGVIYTDIPLSTGDQVAMIQLATTLRVPIRMQDVPFAQPVEPVDPEKPAEQYSVVYLAAVIKGGFASQEEAVEYIEAVLGKDAMEHMDIHVAIGQEGK